MSLSQILSLITFKGLKTCHNEFFKSAPVAFCVVNFKYLLRLNVR